MKLYGHPMSTCTRKVLTVLQEKGHEAQFVLVDIMKGEQKQPDYIAKHPFGVVPLLEDDGFIVYESRAIIRYLDGKLSGLSLTPTDLKARAMMDQWLSVEQSYFASPVIKILMQRVIIPSQGGQTDQAVVSDAQTEVVKALDVADKALAKQEYFAGSTFSLADIGWMPYVQYLFTASCGDLVTGRANINNWWKRVSTRPSWVKVSA
jgi:glutathione S-transferase